MGAEQLFICDMLIFIKKKHNCKKHDKALSVFIFQVLCVFFFFLIRRQNVIRPYARLIVPKTELQHLNMFARGKQSGGSYGELALISPQGGPPWGLGGLWVLPWGAGAPEWGECAFPVT